MKIRKILAAITSVALVGTMLAGCNNSGNDSNSSTNPPINNGSSTGDNSNSSTPAADNDEKDVKLKVWYAQAEKDLIEGMCKKFAEEHPDQNIEFTFGVCDGDKAKDQISNDPDNAADVFFFAPDHTQALVDAGTIAPVTRNKNDIVSRNLEESSKSVTVDGELYGYPLNSKTYFLYYNKSMFTEDEVKSLDTMLAKDLEGVQYNVCIPLKNTWYTPMMFFPMGCTLTGSDPNVVCDFNSEKGLAAANTMIDLFANPKFCADKDDFEQQYGPMFKEGKMAACVYGPWAAGTYQEALGDNYGVALLPSVKMADGTEVKLGGFSQYNAVGVKAGCEFPITAADLADYLTNKDSQKQRISAIGDSPTNLELANDASAFEGYDAIKINVEQCKNTKLQAGSMGSYWTSMSGIVDNIGTTVTKDNIKEKMDEMVKQVTSGGISG